MTVTGKRLVIVDIEVKNFKSYFGESRLGPFHSACVALLYTILPAFSNFPLEYRLFRELKMGYFMGFGFVFMQKRCFRCIPSRLVSSIPIFSAFHAKTDAFTRSN